MDLGDSVYRLFRGDDGNDGDNGDDDDGGDAGGDMPVGALEAIGRGPMEVIREEEPFIESRHNIINMFRAERREYGDYYDTPRPPSPEPHVIMDINPYLDEVPMLQDSEAIRGNFNSRWRVHDSRGDLGRKRNPGSSIEDVPRGNIQPVRHQDYRAPEVEYHAPPQPQDNLPPQYRDISGPYPEYKRSYRIHTDNTVNVPIAERPEPRRRWQDPNPFKRSMTLQNYHYVHPSWNQPPQRPRRPRRDYGLFRLKEWPKYNPVFHNLK